MPVVPYIFADNPGPIPLSQLDVNFANVKAFAESAGVVTGNIQANITSLGTLTALTVTGNVIAPLFIGNVVGNLTGNVTGNISGNLTVGGANTQVVFNDSGFANAVAGMTFNKSSNAFVVSGNITGGNLRTAGSISATGNIIGGNLLSVTSISAAGNISAGFVSVSGNVNAGGYIVGNIIGSVSAVGNTGYIQYHGNTGNLDGNANLTFDQTNAIFYSYKIHCGNGGFGTPVGISTLYLANVNPTTIYMGGDASNIYIGNSVGQTTFAHNVSVVGNITGGNLNTSGVVSATGNVTGSYIIGNGSQLTGIVTSSNAALLTGNTLSSNVTNSSLTTVGTLTSLSVAGNVTANNFIGSGAGTPTVSSNVGLILSSPSRVTVQGGGLFRIPVLSAAQIANLTPAVGDMVVNTTTGLAQIYLSTGWGNIFTS